MAGLLDAPQSVQPAQAGVLGEASYFDKLLKNLLSPRGLKIVGATLRQVSSGSKGDFINEQLAALQQAQEYGDEQRQRGALKSAFAGGYGEPEKGSFKSKAAMFREILAVTGDPALAAKIASVAIAEPMKMGPEDTLVSGENPDQVLRQGTPKPIIQTFYEGNTRVMKQSLDGGRTWKPMGPASPLWDPNRPSATEKRPLTFGDKY